MNSFEEEIYKHQQIQKSLVETFTGKNELFDIVDTLRKAGVPEDEMIEKAKYIRREGTPGNYKYIYEEPKENRIKTDKVGDSGKNKKEEHFFNYVKSKLNKKDGSPADDTFTAKWMATHQGVVEDLRKEYKEKDSTQNKEEKKKIEGLDMLNAKYERAQEAENDFAEALSSKSKEKEMLRDRWHNAVKTFNEALKVRDITKEEYLKNK